MEGLLLLKYLGSFGILQRWDVFLHNVLEDFALL